MWYDSAMKEERAEKKQKRREARAEKERAKRAAQAAKDRARLEQHVVVCPHCGKNVLDHMTACPYCKGELRPSGYRPVDAGKYRKIKIACTAVGLAIAVALIVVIFVMR